MLFSRGWANFSPLAMPVSRKAEPIPCYRHGLFRKGLGQLKATSSLTLEQLWAISSMSFSRCWANSMLLAMPVSREAGSIPCYRYCIFGGGLGQLKATSSLALEQLWANSMLLAMPASREAGSIPCYRHCIFRGGLGQLNAISSPTSEQPWAIGSMPFGRCWANPMLSAWSLCRGAGPTQSHWQPHLGATLGYQQHVIRQVLGQFHAIGHACFKGSWVNPMLSAWSLWRGSRPTQSHR